MAGKKVSKGPCIQCGAPERQAGRRKCQDCVNLEWANSNKKKSRDKKFDASFGLSHEWLRKSIMSGFTPTEMSKLEVIRLRQAKAAYNNVSNHQSSRKPTVDKNRKEISSDTDAYLKAGGEIQHVPDGETAFVAHKKNFVINARTNKNLV